MSQPGDSRPIALVLDTTAILAYAAGSMHVHEPILLAGEAGQVHGHHLMSGLLQPGHHELPVGGAAARAVDENEGRRSHGARL